jgi:DNA topoisomerase-1
VRRGRGFAYLTPDGERVTDEATLARIRSLAIPPAWTDVWISPSARGHMQATGRDAKGRKQFRYHARWTALRDADKYSRLIGFCAVLPKIRRRVSRDLKRPGLDQEKVVATIVRLMETTLIRVGNEEYAQRNHSYGLTTMRNRHVDVEGATLSFSFRGKSGVKHEVDIRDRRVARIVKRCQDLPGQELFQYLDEDGERRSIDSADVNDYLREITGEEFTAKDFRTWAGTVLCALALEEFTSFDSQAEARQNIVRAVESVASRLGNTPAVCRKSYVHPAVLDAYLDGAMRDTLRRRAERELAESLPDLTPEEAAVLALLRERLARDE